MADRDTASRATPCGRAGDTTLRENLITSAAPAASCGPGRAGPAGHQRGAGCPVAGDRLLEERVASTLAHGTALSGALLAVGMLLAWARGSATVNVRPPGSLLPLWQGLGQLEPGAWLTAGLAVLIATPFVRVVVAGVAYWRRGERALAAISLAVLGLLAVGTWLGAAH